MLCVLCGLEGLAHTTHVWDLRDCFLVFWHTHTTLGKIYLARNAKHKFYLTEALFWSNVISQFRAILCNFMQFRAISCNIDVFFVH